MFLTYPFLSCIVTVDFMHILILDHHLSQGAHIKRGLRYECIDADVLLIESDWQEAIHRFDALIFHVSMLNDVSLAVCSWLALNYPRLPLLVIDDRSSAASRREFLRNGVFVYIGRPFSFHQLAVHVKVLVYRNSNLYKKKLLSYQDLKLFLETREMQLNGDRVALRNKEFSLLEYFMLNSGQTLTRNQILEQVWDRNANILTNTVDVHVNSLRKKLKRAGARSAIHTVPCVGYKFE